jgi:hypothetical protein
MKKFSSLFENNNPIKNLIIVDVQQEFNKFFPTNYIENINKYCENFENVYQIWDGHKYDPNLKTNIVIENPTWTFPNQKEDFRKVYGTTASEDVKELCRTANKMLTSPKEREKYGYITIKEGSRLNVDDDFNLLKADDKADRFLVKISNKHNWFYVNEKIAEFLLKFNESAVILGGADYECLTDLIVTIKSFAITLQRKEDLIYSAQTKPI